MSENRTVVLIHGFRDRSSGSNNLDRMKPLLEARGWTVREADYNYAWFFRAKMCNKGYARLIAKLIEPGSYCVAFSNGGYLAYQAMLYDAPFEKIALINPALDVDQAIPKAKRVGVWFSPSDNWTGLAKFIPFTKWGDQGQEGYKGFDVKGRYYQKNIDLACGRNTGHGGVFDRSYTREWLANELHRFFMSDIRST